MRQPEPKGIFSTPIALPFRDAAALAIRIREVRMLGDSEPPLHKIRLMPARECVGIGCSRRKSK
jgi:hypothetical protein